MIAAINANYSLLRVLLTMFALLAGLALLGIAWALCRQPDQLKPFVLWTGLLAGPTPITYLRCRKRSEDFTQSVFDLSLAGLRTRSLREDSMTPNSRTAGEREEVYQGVVTLARGPLERAKSV